MKGVRTLSEAIEKNSGSNSPSFEEALQRLETIVHELEDGKVGLAEALERYEQGVKLLKQCYGLLERAERRIELLSGLDADGNPTTRPFDDEASLALDEKGESRRQRRSRPSNRPKLPRHPAEAGSEEDSGSDIDEPGSLF